MTHSSGLTREDFKNRLHAKIVARVSATLCIVLLGYGYWIAWSSDQMRAEEIAQMSELQRAEQAILDNMEFGRVIVNEHGLIVSANAAFKKWTRWEGCVGEPIYNVMPEGLIRDKHNIGFHAAIARAKFSETKVKPKLIDCKLPRIDDPTKVTHVTIAVSVVKHKEEHLRPYVVAYLFRTKSLSRVTGP